MAAQRPQQPRQNVFDRLLAVQVRKAGYHLPELGVAGYVLAAAATLPTPAAAAAIATPGIIDVAAKARRGRGLIRDLHTNAAVRRRWTHACVRGGAANRPPLHSVELDTPYGPRPVKVERVPTGHRIHLHSPKSYDDLIANQSKVEGLLGCRFTLKVDTLNPSRAVATLIERDALRDLEALNWPLADATRTSAWDPLPYGIDDDHQPLYLGGMGAGHALIAGITGSGKALDVETPIATTTGWKQMGDLVAGDRVFDEQGQPCNVTGAWQVQYDRPCYEVEFSDGSSIVADADHLWITETYYDRRNRRRTRQRSTRLPGPVLDRLRACSTTGETTLTDLIREIKPEQAESVVWRVAQSVPSRPGRGTRGYQGGRPPARIFDRHDLIETLVEHGSRARWDQRRTATPVTTEAIRRTVREHNRANHSIRVAGPLALAEVDLPIDPYILGLWLGDGISRGGRITCGHADLEYMSRFGVPTPSSLATPSPLIRVPGLTSALRREGLLHNKHVPAPYLRSSIRQRRALLAGLLDADGTAVAGTGQVQFTNTNERLATATHELACSLGYRPTFRPGIAKLNGRIIGPKWDVSFTASDDVFRLPRKLEQHREDRRRSDGARTDSRYIIAVRSVESRPVRCITVDSPSHLYLAGRSMIATHNTVLMNLEIAQAALDPTCNVTIIDGAGGVDYIPWAGAVQSLVDENIQDAIDTLQAIRDEIRRTGTKLKAQNIDGVIPTVCGPVTDQTAIHTHRIVLDEAGYFFNHQQTDKAREFTNLYRELIQLGRKFGLQFILGMQRPSATSISTDVRSQFAYRVGLRTADAETTRMLFPEHDAPRCHEIEAEGFAGVGYVKAEGGGFIRAKTYYLPRHELDAIAARVRDLDFDTQRAAWDPTPTTDDSVATMEPSESTTEPSRPVAEPVGDRPYDQATHDTFDDIISQFDQPDAPASIPPPKARSAKAGEGEDAPASEPPGEALAVDETVALTTLLQLIHDAPPSVIRAGRRTGQTGVRRDYLDMRMLRRVGKGWFAYVGRALDRGLLVMYKAPSGPKGGQPAKLYALTPDGAEFLRRNAGTR